MLVITKGLSKKVGDGDGGDPAEGETKKDDKSKNAVYTSNLAHVKLAERMK